MSSRQGASKSVRGRLLAAVMGAVCLSLAAPSAASAGTVGLNGGELSFLADDGVENTITVTGGGGTITVRDAGNNVLFLPFTDADEQCTHPTPDSATCPATSVDVDSGDLNDTIDATGASVAGTGSVGGVFLSGGEGNDTLLGSELIDTLSGDTGNDTLEAHSGNDFVTGGDGNDSLAGGAGDDSMEVVAFATFGDDAIDGGAGDDTLVQPQRAATGMSDGADSFTGGPGRDKADYASSEGPLALSLDGQPNDGYAMEGDNLAADVEDLSGGPAPDTITGSDSANRIDAGGGDDVVRTLGGDDQLEGGADAGSDTLDGGVGTDRLVGGPGDDALQGASGDDTLEGGGGTDTATGGDGVDAIAGGPGIDNLSGGPGDDAIRGADAGGVGGDGADTIRGNEGLDRISGEGGDDVIEGGAGPDVLSGGVGKDVADYRAGDSPVDVSIDDQANDGTLGEADNVATDVEDVNGSNFNSTILGTPDANTLSGGTGEDYTDGAAGPDALSTGAGGDTVRSRDGVADTVDCGPGPDFAIADPADEVKPTCERTDRGKSKPRPGRTVIVKPDGTNLLKLPGIRRQVPLSDTVGLPLGSALDSAGTAVNLLASTRGGGSRQTGTFSGGAFTIRQPGGRLTELRLSGTLELSKCGRPRVSTAASRSSLRRLVARARGRFRVRGRYSSTTVANAAWTVEDRCDGTVTRVTRGTVTVLDLRRKHTKKLRAGQSYIARATRSRR